MTGHWLEEALAACRMEPPSSFPRNLAEEALLALPVDLVALPKLTSDSVRDWLAERGRHHRVAETSRELHGCMVAERGHAALFHDSEDSDEEQRFTLAHEVAHFVLEHLLPRARALERFGPEVLPVLNGERPPTPAEALSSVLDQIPMGTQVRLMERDPSGAGCSGLVEVAERRADRLALELLAPSELARAVMKEAPEEERESRLASHFGLPPHVARKYARTLANRERPQRFSIVEFLGEAGR